MKPILRAEALSGLVFDSVSSGLHGTLNYLLQQGYFLDICQFTDSQPIEVCDVENQETTTASDIGVILLHKARAARTVRVALLLSPPEEKRSPGGFSP